jgi:hypothetical protein
MVGRTSVRFGSRTLYADAPFIAALNLTKPVIQEAVAKRRERLAEKVEVTAERVIREMAMIGFSNMQDYMRVGKDGDPHLDFFTLTRDQAAALSEVTVEDFRDDKRFVIARFVAHEPIPHWSTTTAS